MFLSYFLYIGKWRKKFRAQTCYHFSKKRQTTSIFIANTEFGSFDIKLNIIVLKCEAYSNFHFDFSLLSSLSLAWYIKSEMLKIYSDTLIFFPSHAPLSSNVSATWKKREKNETIWSWLINSRGDFCYIYWSSKESKSRRRRKWNDNDRKYNLK